MQIDRLTTALARCRCGNKPDHYTIGYGPTPYYAQCVRCRKHVNDWTDIGGSRGDYQVIWFWNKIAPLTRPQIRRLRAKEGPDFDRMPAEFYEHWSPS